MNEKLPFWIKNGVCLKEELSPDSICNLGYACDGCPYNVPKTNSWQSLGLLPPKKHQYGRIGKPIFICSKNFEKPIKSYGLEFQHETEPCGFHQADIWCIINGNVCPHLIMGIQPNLVPSIEEEVNNELNKSQLMLEDAKTKAKENGWTPQLKEQFVRAYAIHELYAYQDEYLNQNIFVYDSGQWGIQNTGTWEEFIDIEFKRRMVMHNEHS